MNLNLLQELRNEGLLLRRINIRQVEGEGFQEIPELEFKSSNRQSGYDRFPLLQELFPLGHVLKNVHWETHDGRTRLPIHLTDEHVGEHVHGRAGLTFGRQIGAYPILIGVPYHIPLETSSDIMITGHGARSITGVEIGLSIDTASEKQLEAIPGIGKKAAWNLVSARAKLKRKEEQPTIESIFNSAKLQLNSTILSVFADE